jgi:magnesium transporter
MIRREADLIADIAKESGLLEQRVMLGGDLEDPEAFLEELFQAWYVLLAVRTMATHSSASYGRMARLVRFLPDAAPPLFADIADQFDVIKTMADGQREFLHGVIEFYQTRTSTHLTIAAEKSAAIGIQQNENMRRITAWVAIVAVPTAVTGFFGQNVSYPGSGTTAGFITSTLIIIILASVLLSPSNAEDGYSGVPGVGARAPSRWSFILKLSVRENVDRRWMRCTKRHMNLVRRTRAIQSGSAHAADPY